MSAFLRRADLIKFVKTWLAIMCVNVLQESLKRKTATYARVSTSCNDFNSLGGGGGGRGKGEGEGGMHGGGSGSPFYELYRYVGPQRVWFFSRFGLELGMFFFKKEVFHHYR